MSINFKYLALAIPAIIVGCGGSSGGDDGSSDEPTNIVVNDTDIQINPTTDGNPLINSNTSTVVSASDVFDPNNLGNESVCSAPFYEALSGIYQGTMSVSNADGLSCSWNVELRMVRFYELDPPVTRSFCEFDVEFLATPTTAITLGQTVFDPEGGEDGEGGRVQQMIPCLAADQSGEIFNTPSTNDGRELTDPEFPLDAEFQFFNDVFLTSQQTGLSIGVFPAGEGSGFIDRASRLQLVFDGSGAVTVEAATRPDPFWSTNITKVQTDIEFLATEF